jgi:hypothetical protein
MVVEQQPVQEVLPETHSLYPEHRAEAFVTRALVTAVGVLDRPLCVGKDPGGSSSLGVRMEVAVRFRDRTLQDVLDCIRIPQRAAAVAFQRSPKRVEMLQEPFRLGGSVRQTTFLP